jgi:predicted signal transduction protein with EAL and GGDEF domain
MGMDEGCTLYRLGGDEFILIAEVLDSEGAIARVSSILNNFKAKFIIKNIILYVSLSIGLALYPEHGENIEEMIKSADIAMYKAKDEGKNRYIIYGDDMNRAFTERMAMEKHLRSEWIKMNLNCIISHSLISNRIG